MHHGRPYSCDQQLNCKRAISAKEVLCMISQAALRVGRRTQPRAPPWSGCPHTTPGARRTRWQPRPGQVLRNPDRMLHMTGNT
jgi:hypothetical protein